MKPTDIEAMSSAIPYKTCTLDADHGTQASWYQKLQDVTRGVVKTRVIYEAEVVMFNERGIPLSSTRPGKQLQISYES